MCSLPMSCPRRTRFRLAPLQTPQTPPAARMPTPISIDDLICRLLQPGHCRTLQLPADH